jgi:hypothetical protein
LSTLREEAKKTVWEMFCQSMACGWCIGSTTLRKCTNSSSESSNKQHCFHWPKCCIGLFWWKEIQRHWSEMRWLWQWGWKIEGRPVTLFRLSCPGVNTHPYYCCLRFFKHRCGFQNSDDQITFFQKLNVFPLSITSLNQFYNISPGYNETLWCKFAF